MYNLHLWILFVSLQMAGYFESLLAVIKQEVKIIYCYHDSMLENMIYTCSINIPKNKRFYGLEVSR